MNIKDAVNYICDFSKGKAEQFDVIASNSRMMGLSVFQGQVQNTEISDSVGLGIRVIKNGHPGYAHTERLTKDALEQTFKDAICHTQWTEKINIDLPLFVKNTSSELNFNSALEYIELPQIKDFCIELEKSVFEKSKEIENVPYLGADKSSNNCIIANSQGFYFQECSNSISVGAGAVACRNGVKKLGNFVKSGRDWNLFNVEEIASKTANYATELFDAKKIQSAKLPIILSERVSSRFISMYSSPFFAESMQKGMSRLANKEGEKIASDEFSLWNDPKGELFQHYYHYDSEGVLTKRVKVVEKGIFNSALYNLETASKAGVESTGNGSRDFGSKMSTCFYNLLVPTGEKSTEELLKIFPKCLLIVRLEGNSGCNPVSGELSIGAHGFYFENGVLKHPVDGVTLSGNYFDMIKNIVGIGNEYYNPFSNYKVPSLAIDDVSVSN